MQEINQAPVSATLSSKIRRPDGSCFPNDNRIADLSVEDTRSAALLLTSEWKTGVAEGLKFIYTSIIFQKMTSFY